jgi:hypothetical protein
MDVTVGRGRFHLLRQALLFNVTVNDTADRFNASIREISLKYRPLPLFNRKLVITELKIIHPVIRLRKGERPPLSSSRRILPSAQPSADFASIEEKTPPATPILPVDIFVERFHLEDGGLQYEQTGANEKMEASVKGINAFGEDITFRSSEDLQVPLHLEVKDTLHLLYRRQEKAVRITAPIEFFSRARFTSLTGEVALKAAFTPVLDVTVSEDSSKEYTVPVMKIEGTAVLETPDSVKVNDLRISSGENSFIRAEGTVSNLFDQPDINLRVKESRLQLDEWWDILTEVAPLFGWDRWLRRRFLSGTLRFTDTRVNGALRAEETDLQVNIRWNLEGVSYRDEDRGIAVVGLNQEGSFSGAVLPPGRGEADFSVHSEIVKIRLPEIAGIPFLAEPLSLRLRGSASRGWTNAVLDLKWKEDDTGFPGKGEVRLLADSLNLNDPFGSLNPSFEGRGRFKELPLTGVSPNVLKGAADVTCMVGFKPDGETRLDVDGTAIGLRFRSRDKTLEFARLPFTISTFGKINSAFLTGALDSLQVEAPPYFALKATTEMQTGEKKAVINGDLRLDVGAIRSAADSLFPDPLQNLEINGVFAGDFRAAYLPQNSTWNADLLLHCAGFSFLSPQTGANFRTPDFALQIASCERQLTFEADFSEGELNAPHLRRDSYRRLSLAMNLLYDIAENDGKGSLTLTSEELGLNANAGLILDSLVTGLSGKAEIRLAFEKSQETEIVEGWFLDGKGGGTLRLELQPDSGIAAEGDLTAEGLNIRRRDAFSLRRLKLRVPFKQTLNIGSEPLEFVRKSENPPLADPIIFASFEHLRGDSSRQGEFTCPSLKIGDYTFTDISGKVEIGSGTLVLPVVRTRAYGGVVQGSIFLDYVTADPDSIRYRGQLYGLNLDTALLPNARRTSGEDSKISAFARWQGRGLSLNGDFDLNGDLYITRIGRRVADNILRFLDPDQEDPSVQTYRNYLRRGWGIKMFSFKMKDDLVYASLTPSKPSLRKPDQWLLSRFIGLGKSITFSRVPLKFFLTAENF